MSTNVGPNPSGFCMCGCGRKTSIAKWSDARYGLVGGQPKCFINGHHLRKGPNAVRHSNGGSVLTAIRKGVRHKIILDTPDYHLVKPYRWFVMKKSQTFYAVRNIWNPKTQRSESSQRSMHALLLPKAKRIDHKDGDGLNNRRSNIRPATVSQNGLNKRKQRNGVTSKYRGVFFAAHLGKFRTRIQVRGVMHELGVFKSEIAAARAYDAGARKYAGEFARVNFQRG